jgi:thiol-disulfide isomerase/thioredoxin
MMGRAVSLAVGVLVAGISLAELFVGSADLRVALAVGLGTVVGAGIWNGRRGKGDMLDLTLLVLPLLAAFLALVATELPALWPVCPLWAAGALSAHALGRAPRSAYRASALLVVLIIGTGYGAVTLPRTLSRAFSREGNGTVPEIALLNLTGAAIEPRDLHGRVVVLDFFATSCKPCVAELPRIAEVAARLSGRSDVTLLVVGSETGGETLERVREFAGRSRQGLTLAWDPQHRTRDACGVRGTPTLVILDAGGKLRRLHIGFNPAETGFASEVLHEVDEMCADGRSAPGALTP